VILVGGEDLAVRLLQLGSWCYPEFVGQHLMRIPVDVKRPGLVAAAVTGKHQLNPDVLAQRVLGGQPPQFWYQLGVPAQSQVGVDAVRVS
jgi:hypothetical protein